jgi:hypothetical protein
VGYVSSSLTLMSATTLTPASTPGAQVTGSASQQFAGSDFDKGLIRVNVTAVSSPTITDWGVYLQSSPDNGTTWYPVLKDRATAPGYAQLGTAAPAANDLLESVVTSFPGALFRVAVYAVGSAGTITVSVTGEFQKRVPDNS